MSRFHNVSSCHTGESALAILCLGTSGSKPSALPTAKQFVCRRKLRDSMCDSSFHFESTVPLYIMECSEMVTNARHHKLWNVFVSEIPKYQLDARRFQVVNKNFLSFMLMYFAFSVWTSECGYSQKHKKMPFGTLALSWRYQSYLLPSACVYYEGELN